MIERATGLAGAPVTDQAAAGLPDASVGTGLRNGEAADPGAPLVAPTNGGPGRHAPRSARATGLESRWRSIAKTLSWRLVATVTTALLVWLVTGRITLALLVGGVEAASKLALYYLHERTWDRIPLGRRTPQPAVLWLTGLPGAGKTTVAHRLVAALRERGHRVEHLDGDSIRSLFPGTGFTREERDGHARRVGHLAATLERHGVWVVVSLISPYRDSRRFARDLCRRFVEIHVATPLEECERRDPKGLYARARRGEIQHLTGIDDPYEPPERAEIAFDTRTLPPEAAAERILERVSVHA